MENRSLKIEEIYKFENIVYFKNNLTIADQTVMYIRSNTPPPLIYVLPVISMLFPDSSIALLYERVRTSGARGKESNY